MTPFSTISAAHGFPCDLPSPEAAIGLLSMMFSTPRFYALVAECDGRIVGGNVLAERAVIHGVGPVTIDPRLQNAGVGRGLMEGVMDRANQNSALGMRLVQAAFHNRSLSLYASLGFDIREPLSCMQGRTAFLDAWCDPHSLQMRPPALPCHGGFTDLIEAPSWRRRSGVVPRAW
jgi:GNAT superfamily N-acetyltransferase